MNIYLARPISGCSYDDVSDYYKKTVIQLKKLGYNPLHPMTAKKALRNEKKLRKAGGYTNPFSTNHSIVTRDFWMVRKADIVYVNLTGVKEVSIGCIMELAVAFENHKYIIVVMDQYNIHQHAFVLETASIILNTHEEVMNYLKKLIKGQF